MRQQTITKEQLRNEITRIENKWFKTKQDREELQRLRKHYYQKQYTRLMELQTAE